MTTAATYPIGTPGTPWGAAEKAQWLASQVKHRSYADEVLGKIDALRSRLDVSEYGLLHYGSESYPLFAIKSSNWREDLPHAGHRRRARL